MHILPAGRLGGGPIGMLKALRSVLAGRRQAQGAVPRISRPTRWSASAAIRRFRRCSRRARRKVPTILHEQNAVLGRVNRLLAGDARAIATAYAEVERLKPRHRAKVGAGRQSGARGGRCGWASCPSRRSTTPRRSRSSSPAGARARPSLGGWCPTRWACCRRRCGTGCRSSSNAAPTISRRCARAMPTLNIPAELLTYIEDMPDRLGRGASGHRPRRGVDHRRADRRRAAGDPRPAADRDRRSPDRQCARNGQGRRARG